jgi:xanthine/CO dehydrogenase XdhC/CoxF family maturation factor
MMVRIERRRLCIVGRGDTAERLCELGGMLDYNQIHFADDVPAELGPGDHVIIAHEEASRARALLLEAAGREPQPGYLGLAAPRAEALAALVALAQAGVPEARVRGISAPAGLDVGAQTAEELAIAIAAELVAVKRERRPPPRGGGGASGKGN